MSVTIKNPAYIFSGNHNVELQIYDANGNRIECDIFNATINKVCGSIANPFNIYPIVTGSITIDYDLFEGQKITLKFHDISLGIYRIFGEFIVQSVSFGGGDKKSYTLASTLNISKKLPEINNMEYYLIKNNLSYEYSATPIGNISYIFNLSDDKEIGYPVIYDGNKGYINYDVTEVDFASNYNASFGYANDMQETIYTSPDCIYESGETKDGFSRIGIDWVGYKYNYLKINIKEAASSKMMSIDEDYIEKVFTSTETTDYFYLEGNADGRSNEVVEEKSVPTGTKVSCNMSYVSSGQQKNATVDAEINWTYTYSDGRYRMALLPYDGNEGRYYMYSRGNKAKIVGTLTKDGVTTNISVTAQGNNSLPDNQIYKGGVCKTTIKNALIFGNADDCYNYVSSGVIGSSYIGTSGDDKPLELVHSETKPEGNGIIVEIPWTIGKFYADTSKTLDSDFYRKQFINFVMKDSSNETKDFLLARKDLDLTTRSIKIPFDYDTYASIGDSRISVLDYDFYSNYGEDDELIYVDDNFVDSHLKYTFPAYQVSVTYDGTFNMTISSGDAWEGNASEVSASSSTVSVSTSNGSMNLDAIYSLVNSLQRQVADVKQGYVTNEDFATKVAELFDVARLNGSVLEDLTIKGSAFEDGTITGSKIQDGTITGTKIDSATIEGSNIKGGTIEGTHLTSAIFENGKIHGGIIEATELKDIPFASMDGAFIDDLQTTMIDTHSITSEFATSTIQQFVVGQGETLVLKEEAVAQLMAGTLYTNNIDIQSENGNMLLKDNYIRFRDNEDKTRTFIGRANDSDDYAFLIYGPGGNEGSNLLFDATGITANGIPSGLLVDDMISSNTKIQSGKLDISGLVTTINDETNNYVINSNSIYFDDKANRLSSVLTTMETNIDSVQAQINGTVKYYTDLKETPTLENYPANTWYEAEYPSDDLYPSDDTYGVYYTDEVYRRYVGTKAFTEDGSNAYLFSMLSDNTYGWKEVTGTIEAQLVERVSALELSSEQFASRFSEFGIDSQTGKYTFDSMFEQTAQEISSKVSANGIISAINQTAEKILIDANKINLQGYVTISSLGKDGTVTIDGGRIDAESLFSKNISVEGGRISVTQKGTRSDYIVLTGEWNQNNYNKLSLSPEYMQVENYTMRGSYNYSGGRIKTDGKNIDFYSKYTDGTEKRTMWLSCDGYIHTTQSIEFGQISLSAAYGANKQYFLELPIESGTLATQEWVRQLVGK